MILTGKVSRTDGGTAKGPDSGMASGVDSGMAGDLDSGPGSNQLPGLAQPHSAHRRVVAVIVDGSGESVSALRQAASQARQRNATLDVIYLLPEQADARAVTLARVRLGEFSRRACPYGVGAPVRLRVEQGDLAVVLSVIQADAELLVTVSGPDTGTDTEADQAVPKPTTAHQDAAHWPASYRHLMHPRGTWLNTLLHASS